MKGKRLLLTMAVASALALGTVPSMVSRASADGGPQPDLGCYPHTAGHSGEFQWFYANGHWYRLSSDCY